MEPLKDTELTSIIEALHQLKKAENITPDADFRVTLKQKLLLRADVLNEKKEEPVKKGWWQWRLWMALVPSALVLVVIVQHFLYIPVSLTTNNTLSELQAFNDVDFNKNQLGSESERQWRGENSINDNNSLEQHAETNQENQEARAASEGTPLLNDSVKKSNDTETQKTTSTDTENKKEFSPSIIAQNILKLPQTAIEKPSNIPDNNQNQLNVGQGEKITASESQPDTRKDSSVNRTEKNTTELNLNENDTFVDSTTLPQDYQVTYPATWDTKKQQQFESEVIQPLIKQKYDASWGKIDPINSIVVQDKDPLEATLQIYYDNGFFESFQYVYKTDSNVWYRK